MYLRVWRQTNASDVASEFKKRLEELEEFSAQPICHLMPSVDISLDTFKTYQHQVLRNVGLSYVQYSAEVIFLSSGARDKAQECKSILKRWKESGILSYLSGQIVFVATDDSDWDKSHESVWKLRAHHNIVVCLLKQKDLDESSIIKSIVSGFEVSTDKLLEQGNVRGREGRFEEHAANVRRIITTGYKKLSPNDRANVHFDSVRLKTFAALSLVPKSPLYTRALPVANTPIWFVVGLQPDLSVAIYCVNDDGVFEGVPETAWADEKIELAMKKSVAVWVFGVPKSFFNPDTATQNFKRNIMCYDFCTLMSRPRRSDETDAFHNSFILLWRLNERFFGPSVVQAYADPHTMRYAETQLKIAEHPLFALLLFLLRRNAVVGLRLPVSSGKMDDVAQEEWKSNSSLYSMSLARTNIEFDENNPAKLVLYPEFERSDFEFGLPSKDIPISHFAVMSPTKDDSISYRINGNAVQVTRETAPEFLQKWAFLGCTTARASLQTPRGFTHAAASLLVVKRSAINNAILYHGHIVPKRQIGKLPNGEIGIANANDFMHPKDKVTEARFWQCESQILTVGENAKHNHEEKAVFGIKSPTNQPTIDLQKRLVGIENWNWKLLRSTLENMFYDGIAPSYKEFVPFIWSDSNDDDKNRPIANFYGLDALIAALAQEDLHPMDWVIVQLDETDNKHLDAASRQSLLPEKEDHNLPAAWFSYPGQAGGEYLIGVLETTPTVYDSKSLYIGFGDQIEVSVQNIPRTQHYYWVCNIIMPNSMEIGSGFSATNLVEWVKMMSYASCTFCVLEDQAKFVKFNSDARRFDEVDTRFVEWTKNGTFSFYQRMQFVVESPRFKDVLPNYMEPHQYFKAFAKHFIQRTNSNAKLKFINYADAEDIKDFFAHCRREIKNRGTNWYFKPGASSPGDEELVKYLLPYKAEAENMKTMEFLEYCYSQKQAVRNYLDGLKSKKKPTEEFSISNCKVQLDLTSRILYAHFGELEYHKVVQNWHQKYRIAANRNTALERPAKKPKLDHESASSLDIDDSVDSSEKPAAPAPPAPSGTSGKWPDEIKAR